MNGGPGDSIEARPYEACEHRDSVLITGKWRYGRCGAAIIVYRVGRV